MVHRHASDGATAARVDWILGRETGTDGKQGRRRDFTLRHIPLDSDIGPAERMPTLPELFSLDLD
jgi:hypothetical protein